MNNGKLIFVTSLLVLADAVHAAPPAAPPQPLYLEADQVNIDDKQGVSVYQGNVKLTRGAMTITSDKMTVHRTKQDLQKIIASGTPVHLDQAASATTKEIHGESLHAEYDAQSGEILLTESAKLRQDADEFTGDVIRYNVNTEIVDANKGKSDQRVRVVIHPKSDAKN